MTTPDVMTRSPLAPDEPAVRAESVAAHPDWSDRAEALSWWTRFKLGLVRGFLVGWVRLFGLAGLYRFGQVFGWLEFAFGYKRRRRVHVRIDQIFPEGLPAHERRAVTRRYFMRTRCDKMLYMIFDRLPRNDILARLHFPNRRALDEALSRGNGAYVAMSHYGSHHVAAMIMALLGYKLAGVRDRNEGELRRYVQNRFAETFPEFSAIRMFFADAFPRDIFRCYRDNFVVASALDVDVDRVRDSRVRACPVTLFGETRQFLTGPVQMALRCNAMVFQGFVVARRNFHYDFILSAPLIDPAADGESADVLGRALQNYADGIAAHVREFPCHLTKI